MSVEVRKARDEDVPTIAEIHVRAWQAAYRGILPDELLDSLSVSERKQSWRALLSGGGNVWLTLVAECVPDRLCGFCSVATPSRDADADAATAELAALYVDPSTTRQGAGSAMLTAALGELRKEGWREVVLWVLPENRSALAFYGRFGFEIEEVERSRSAAGGLLSECGCPWTANLHHAGADSCITLASLIAAHHPA